MSIIDFFWLVSMNVSITKEFILFLAHTSQAGFYFQCNDILQDSNFQISLKFRYKRSEGALDLEHG